MSDDKVSVFANEVPKDIYNEFKILCIRMNISIREGIIAAMSAAIAAQKIKKANHDQTLD